jgi:hypothetical protein
LDTRHSTLPAVVHTMPRIVLGPVVGLVTDTTARVLLEVDEHILVKMVLITPYGNAHRTLNRDLQAFSPFVFCFEGLLPGTRYSITIDGVEAAAPPQSPKRKSKKHEEHHRPTLPSAGVDHGEDVRGGFNTQPEGGFKLRKGTGGSGRDPCFAVVSSNDVVISQTVVESEGNDLWEDLARRGKKGEIDAILHVGNQVFMDSGLYTYMDGQKILETNPDESVWWQCVQLVESRGGGYAVTEELLDEVTARMRSVWHETWGHESTRDALAFSSNMMIYGDREIRNDWGESPEDSCYFNRPEDLVELLRSPPQSPKGDPRHRVFNPNRSRPGQKVLDPTTTLLGAIAYRLVVEYEKQLYEDIPVEHLWGDPRTAQKSLFQALTVKLPGPDYHFWRFGDVGILFMDVRGCRSFYREHYPVMVDGDFGEEALEFPMLGTRQWKNIEDVLKKGGKMEKCTALIAVTPLPIAFTSITALLGVLPFLMIPPEEVRGNWGGAQYLPEMKKLMDALFAWRERGGRGGVGREVLLVGGHAKQGAWSDILPDGGGRFIRQLCSGGIATERTKVEDFVSKFVTSGGKQMMCDNWSLKHDEWTKRRHYAIFRLRRDSVKVVVGRAKAVPTSKVVPKSTGGVGEEKHAGGGERGEGGVDPGGRPPTLTKLLEIHRKDEGGPGGETVATDKVTEGRHPTVTKLLEIHRTGEGGESKTSPQGGAVQEAAEAYPTTGNRKNLTEERVVVDGHFVLAFGENTLERLMHPEHHRVQDGMSLSTIAPVKWGVLKSMAQCVRRCIKPCADNSHRFIPQKLVVENAEPATPLVGPGRE